MQRDSLVLRGRLVDFDKGLFGLFLIVIERNTEQPVFHVNAIMGNSQFISTFDSSNPPIEEFEKSMMDLLLRGEATIKNSKRLENILIKNQNLIIKLLEQEDMQNTLHMALSSRLNLFFEAKFNLTIQSHTNSEPYEYHDVVSEVALKFSYEETNMFRKQFALPNDIDIIKLEPYLSVDGKYTMSLQRGDLIYCTPNKNIMENKILLQHHELIGAEGELKKMIGTVQFVKPTHESLILIVQTTPSLYGIIEVANNVLIEVPLIEEEEEELVVDEESIIERHHFRFRQITDKIMDDPLYTIVIIIGIAMAIFFFYGIV